LEDHLDVPAFDICIVLGQETESGGAGDWWLRAAIAWNMTVGDLFDAYAGACQAVG
jgi:hypothetical protein